MSDDRHRTGEHYRIRVRGRLDARWAGWFDGLQLAAAGDGTTVLSGPIADQAALHGLLQKLRDLGLTLLSLTSTDLTDPIDPPGATS